MATYTLSTLSARTDSYLGAEFIYKDDDKTKASNASRLYLKLNYDITEFIQTVDVTFTSGIGDIPSDYLRHVKLFDEDDPKKGLVKLDANEFDSETENTWCIKYDESSSAQKFFIHPTDITTRKLRYVIRSTDVSDSSDELGFNDYWLEAQACYNAYWLLENDRQPVADRKLMQANNLIAGALRHQGADDTDQPLLTTAYDTEGPLVNSEEG